QEEFAVVTDPIPAEGALDLPILPTDSESVAVDRRSVEQERDAAVGEVRTNRHLGASFVRPHADAQPGADPLRVVPDVDVAAFVPIGGCADRMNTLVDPSEPGPHGGQSTMPIARSGQLSTALRAAASSSAGTSSTST